MTTHEQPRRERDILQVFLGGYESRQWASAKCDWVEEHTPGSVELIATRADGTSLAIEHTLVEIFVGDKLDVERLRGFLELREDPELVVAGKTVIIQIPRDTLVPGFEWQPVINEFRSWLKESIETFPLGESEHDCPVSEPRITNNAIKVKVEVIEDAGKAGHLFVNRYGDADTAEAVDRALARKLPKLTACPVNRRILMFERNQFKQDEQLMFDTVERLRGKHPQIAAVDELWCVETIAYEEHRPIEQRALFFRQYELGTIVKRLSFNGGRYYP